LVRPEQNEAATQLMTHASQISASNLVGQVAIQPFESVSRMG
jgi:hypothetical protein